MYKQETKTVWDVPPGFLCLEDKITMLCKLQDMQIRDKQNSLSSYGGPDYSSLMKKLAEACEAELEAQSRFLQNMNTEKGE